MQKYVIIDTETTGLDAEKHEIVSFGGIVLIDHKIVETIEIKIKPAHIDTADQKALEINGYSPDKWQYANTQKEGAYKIAHFIERHRDKIFAGHNLQFDIKFIQALGKNQNVYMSIPAMYPYIDTRDLCRSMLSGYGLSSMSLDNICAFLGWHRRASHTALSDCEDCAKIIINFCPPTPKILVRLSTMKLLRNFRSLMYATNKQS